MVVSDFGDMRTVAELCSAHCHAGPVRLNGWEVVPPTSPVPLSLLESAELLEGPKDDGVAASAWALFAEGDRLDKLEAVGTLLLMAHEGDARILACAIEEEGLEANLAAASFDLGDPEVEFREYDQELDEARLADRLAVRERMESIRLALVDFFRGAVEDFDGAHSAHEWEAAFEAVSRRHPAILESARRRTEWMDPGLRADHCPWLSLD